MAAEQRKLLEQLMGNVHDTRTKKVSMSDPGVCRSFVCGMCPHDLFTNTKQDIGPCKKIHAEDLREEYAQLSDREKQRYGFEYDYMRDLAKYIDTCNSRIESAQRRLEKTPDEIRQTTSLIKSIAEITQTINSGLLELEILAEQGLVDLALEERSHIQQLIQTRIDRERELRELTDSSGPSGHQKLQVCDVCGAYLSRLDNDRRLADHFFGKMHLGYAQMRKAYDAFPMEMRMSRGGGKDDDGPRGDGYRSERRNRNRQRRW